MPSTIHVCDHCGVLKRIWLRGCCYLCRDFAPPVGQYVRRRPNQPGPRPASDEHEARILAHRARVERREA